jgi:hypothetical protein
MFWPEEFGVETPMRLVSERHAQGWPASWRVRHPCGSPALGVDVEGGGGVRVMLGGVVRVVLGGVAGVVLGAGVVWVEGVAGCVAVGGVVCVVEAVGGGVCVCAELIGAAIRKPAAARAKTRFMEILRGPPQGANARGWRWFAVPALPFRNNAAPTGQRAARVIT